MDETTGQGTLKLPRRLPKQPNQLFYTEAAETVAEAPPSPKEPIPEFIPMFEMGPELPEPDWPEFPPQEFVLPEDNLPPVPEFVPHDEASLPVHEFDAQDWDFEQPQQVSIQDRYVHEYVARREEFILPEDSVLPPQTLVQPRPIPTPRPVPAAPQPPAPKQILEQQPVSEPAREDSKPSVLPVGDPKPAFARPSGRSRSRPSRPSGSFPTARPSGVFPLPDIPRTTFVGDEQRRSGEYATTSIAEAAPRSSAEEASASRVTKSARRRRTSASAVPALIVLSVLLVGYSFAVGPIESYLESQLIGSVGPSSTLVSLVPWVSLVPVVFLLGGVLWIIAGLIGLRHVKPRARKTATGERVSRRKLKKERRKSPLEQFREEAAKEDIEGVSVYQCWRLLQPFGPDHHILSVFDELEGTLGMRPTDIQSIYQQLVPAAHKDERYQFRTVLDLLRIVRQASLTRA